MWPVVALVGVVAVAGYLTLLYRFATTQRAVYPPPTVKWECMAPTEVCVVEDVSATGEVHLFGGTILDGTGKVIRQHSETDPIEESCIGPEGNNYLAEWTAWVDPVNFRGAELTLKAYSAQWEKLWSVKVEDADKWGVRLAAWPGGVYLVHGKLVHAFDLQGQPLWTCSSARSPLSEFVVTDSGTLVFTEDCITVEAIDHLGAMAWKYSATSMGGGLFSDCLAWSAPDTVYFLEPSYGQLTALNGQTGAVKWQSGTAQLNRSGFAVSSNAGGPSIDAAGNVYFSECGPTSYALDPAGNLRWRFPDPATFMGMMFNYEGPTGPSEIGVFPGGGAVVTSSDGMWLLDDTGSLLASFPQFAGMDGWPVIGRDGLLYLTAGRKLYAVDPKTR